MPTVLITGANRGIGLALTKSYLSKGYKVIAAVRDPQTVPKEIQGELIVIKISAESETDAQEAVEVLKSKYGIEKLDVVIANAAVNLTGNNLVDTDLKDLEITWKVNVRGPLILFKAVLPLLEPKKSKFVVISSGAGTIGKEHRMGQGAYGHSKAAVNYIVRKLHFEHPDLVVMSVNPGWVPTDMGNLGAKWSGMDKTPQSLEVTVPGMIKVIDEATRDNYSGWMTDYDGSRMAF